MSRPEQQGKQIYLPPKEQLLSFVKTYGEQVTPAMLDKTIARVHDLDLHFDLQELIVIAALDEPAKVQDFLDTQIYYNHDHGGTMVRGETAMSPKLVLQTGFAHCFEGALFSYMVNYIHGHNPQFVLLEAREDYDHNLVIFVDQTTGLFGSNAHSRYPGLDGRSASFVSLQSLVQSYYPHYTSDTDPTELTLVGYSQPIDIVEKFGTKWMDSTEDVWDIYFTYINNSVKFYDIQGGQKPHLYPLVRAVQEGWLLVDTQNNVSIEPQHFPTSLVREAWMTYHALKVLNNPYLKEDMEVVVKRFADITGTTPSDLEVSKQELQSLVNHGFTPEALLL